MKKVLAICAIAAAFAVSCSKDRAYEIDKSTNTSSFIGNTEGLDDTKTTINYDGEKYVVSWEGATDAEDKSTAKDKVLLIDSYNLDRELCNYITYYATNVINEGKTCTFKEYGGDKKGDLTPPYYVVFPDYLYVNGDYTLPAVQKYVSSTDAKNFPMIAYSAAATESFDFKNLCGIIHLGIKGNSTLDGVKVKEITIKDAAAEPKAMSGVITINWEEGTITSIDGTSGVTLDCSAANDGTGVALSTDPSTITYFNIAVPAGTYTPAITITTMDGCHQTLTAKSSVSVVRSMFNNFTVAPTEIVFDYAYGKSNCILMYDPETNKPVTSKTGIDITPYCVFADCLRGAAATKAPKASSVEILWKEPALEGMTAAINSNALDITVPEGKYGNALVAIKKDGKILWSFHVWVPKDDPTETITYSNSSQTPRPQVMPFSLGATRVVTEAEVEDEGIVDGFGLYYQWGRKDPFARLKNYDCEELIPGSYSIVGIGDGILDENGTSLEYATENPTTFIKAATGEKSWYSIVETKRNDKMWGAANTVYNPCPVGYVVATVGTWTSSMKSGTIYTKGRTILVSDSETDFYLTSGQISNSTGSYGSVGSYGFKWMHKINGSLAYSFYFSETAWSGSSNSGRASGREVRCVKE